MLSAAEMYRWL